MGDLVGPLVFEPNAGYEISFDGAPPGTYDYVCTPHEMLGMIARLTVE
jgi:plastocyanin